MVQTEFRMQTEKNYSFIEDCISGSLDSEFDFDFVFVWPFSELGARWGVREPQ